MLAGMLLPRHLHFICRPDQVYKAALLYARGYILSKDLRTQCYLSSEDASGKWHTFSNSEGE